MPPLITLLKVSLDCGERRENRLTQFLDDEAAVLPSDVFHIPLRAHIEVSTASDETNYLLAPIMPVLETALTYLRLFVLPGGAVADLGGGRGGPGGGEMVSAQYLRGARRGGEIFWPVGQKFWARGEMKTYIRHWGGE